MCSLSLQSLQHKKTCTSFRSLLAASPTLTVMLLLSFTCTNVYVIVNVAKIKIKKQIMTRQSQQHQYQKGRTELNQKNEKSTEDSEATWNWKSRANWLHIHPLETTNAQRMIVWATLTGHLVILVHSIVGLYLSHANAYQNQVQDPEFYVFGATAFQTVFIIWTLWLLADFGSGVFHWSVDNYGSSKTPILGGIIAWFQGHHAAPLTICERGFENNVYKLCTPFGVQVLLVIKAIFRQQIGSIGTLLLSSFLIFVILSQEFHKMSHATRSQAGPIWNWLQEKGLTISRASHRSHHISPYDGNYCIVVSGLCNEYLDQSGFFRRLEHAIYKINGAESNAWKLDLKLRARTLRGEYELELVSPESSKTHTYQSFKEK